MSQLIQGVIWRTEYHRSRSHEDVEGIWKEVEELTVKGYLLVPDSSIEGYIDATVELAGVREPHHIVRYAPRYEQDLPHILDHKAGHVPRFYRAPQEWQMLPKITDEHRERVRYELGDYLLKLARKGMPPEGMEELLKVRHGVRFARSPTRRSICALSAGSMGITMAFGQCRDGCLGDRQRRTPGGFTAWSIRRSVYGGFVEICPVELLDPTESNSALDIQQVFGESRRVDFSWLLKLDSFAENQYVELDPQYTKHPIAKGIENRFGLSHSFEYLRPRKNAQVAWADTAGNPFAVMEQSNNTKICYLNTCCHSCMSTIAISSPLEASQEFAILQHNVLDWLLQDS